MPESHVISANGLRVHVLAAGPPEGPLVVCLHGFPELARSWLRQLPVLAAAGYRAVAPDQRGYGETELRGPYDPLTLAADVAGLIRVLGRERAVVVGHDWGGAVAWTVAQAHPGVVERLVVMNCPPLELLAAELARNPRQRRRSRYVFLYQLPVLPERRLAHHGGALVARALVGGSHVRTAWAADELAEYRAAFTRPGRAKAAIDWYRAAFRGRLLRRGRIPGRPIAAPTLVLWGARDRFLGVELADPARLRPFFAPGREPEVVLVEEAGHFVQNEAPDRVNAELLRWLGTAA